MSTNRTARLYRAYLAIIGSATAIALAGALFAAWAAEASTAAPTVAPTNTAEPRVTGTARVGQVLTTTRGTWSGTEPVTYAFRWFRCNGPGARRVRLQTDRQRGRQQLRPA